MSNKSSKKNTNSRNGMGQKPYNLPERVNFLISQSRIKEAFDELCITKGQTPEEERFFNIRRALLATQLEEYMLAESFIILAKEGTKNYFYFQALNAETELALKLGDYERGRTCCEEAQLYGGADNRRTNLNLGRILEAEGNYAGAMRNYQIAASSSSNFTIQKEANYSLGALAYALGDFVTAESALKIALRPGKLSQPIYIRLTSIYLKQGRYEEALKMVNDATNNGRIEIDRLSIVPVLVAKKQGRELPKRNSKSYNRNQIIEYSREEALAHIKENHTGTQSTRGNFAETVDIDELFENVKHQMTEDNMINEDILDVYEIDYPNVGYDLDDKLTHKLRVVAIPGTKDILTMYPSGKSAIKKQGVIQSQIEIQKQRGAKQIERFNKRFSNHQPKN